MSSIFIIEEDSCNKFRNFFSILMKYLYEKGFFNKEIKEPMKQIKISTNKLWAILIENDKNDLVKILQRVENKESGYESIVVPENGFTDDDKINAMILSWLKERNVNVINVKEEIEFLEDSLRL